MRIDRAIGAVTTLALLAAGGSGVTGQETSPGRFEIGGLPAINFDSDEGFGYGVIAELYRYGAPDQAPYVWTVQPTVFFTTEGRRDLYAFFDAPHLLSGGWRLTAFLGTERQIATPYYGIGNRTVYDELRDADDGPDPYYYRFGRTRNSASYTLQRDMGRLPLRFLLGGGVERTEIVSVPEDSGTTLYATEVLTGDETVWTNYVRGGLVYDTRDRETGPTAGSWTELLIQWSDESLGADFEFTRWTFADRRYYSLVQGLVFAHRVVVQSVGDGAPIHELFRLQTSFKQQEGLGGSKTVRGLPKNRYVGRGMFVWNSELRWRAGEFIGVGRRFHVVLSAFLDQGRVWGEGLALGEVLSELHRGYGGGLRIGMGENFTAAADVGTSSGNGLGIYLGLGYLY